MKNKILAIVVIFTGYQLFGIVGDPVDRVMERSYRAFKRKAHQVSQNLESYEKHRDLVRIQTDIEKMMASLRPEQKSYCAAKSLIRLNGSIKQLVQNTDEVVIKQLNDSLETFQAEFQQIKNSNRLSLKQLRKLRSDMLDYSVENHPEIFYLGTPRYKANVRKLQQKIKNDILGIQANRAHKNLESKLNEFRERAEAPLFDEQSLRELSTDVQAYRDRMIRFKAILSPSLVNQQHIAFLDRLQNQITDRIRTFSQSLEALQLEDRLQIDRVNNSPGQANSRIAEPQDAEVNVEPQVEADIIPRACRRINFDTE